MIQLTSMEVDLISGDSLNGINFKKVADFKNTDELGIHFRWYFNELEHQVQCIEFWGEEDETIFEDKEAIGFWYRKSEKIPDAVLIKRKTMEMMAVQLRTGRWVLISPRSGGFSIDLDKSTSSEKVFSNTFVQNALPKIKMIKSVGERTH